MHQQTLVWILVEFCVRNAYRVPEVFADHKKRQIVSANTSKSTRSVPTMHCERTPGGCSSPERERLSTSNTPEWTNFHRPLFPNSAQQRPLPSHFKVHYYSNIYTSLTPQTIPLTYCNIFIRTHIRANSCIFWSVSFSLNAKHLKYCYLTPCRMEMLLCSAHTCKHAM